MKYLEKSLEAELRLVGARGWREGAWGVTAYEVRGFPFGGMKMFWDWTEVLIAQHCECGKGR